jgi:cysteine desulfurase
MRKVSNLSPIYFDHVSSTPVHPEVLKTLQEFYPIHYSNAEALHDGGKVIGSMVEASREQVAKLLKVNPEWVTFTSGATEANNAIIKGIALANAHRGKHLITTSVEHSSVLDSYKQLETDFGFEVTYLPVNAEGRISADDLRNALRADTTLVSIMHVNNEIGTIMPVEACAQVVRAHSKAYYHTDEVQAIGKVPFDLSLVDAASLSAHKINGVKGSGVMILKPGVNILSLISGGQQENGRRGGTANAIHNLLFGKTLRLALEDQQEHIAKVTALNLRLRKHLSGMSNVVINSPATDVSPFILNFSVLNLTSEVLLNWFNAQGIYLSAQSTCNSKQHHPSITLSAMGVDAKRLKGALRVGLSVQNTAEEIDRLVSVLQEGVAKYGRP